MKLMVKKSLLTVCAAMCVMSTPTWADEQQLSDRITRLERIIKGQGLMSLLGRVDQLQNEVQRLNGDNEALRHELEQMQRRQREMYIDLDQRLSTPAVTPNAPAAVESIEQQSVTVIDQPVTTDVVTEQPDVIESTTEQLDLSTPSEVTQQPSQNQTAAVEPSPVAVESGEAAYQAALQTLRSGEYEKAITALSAFPESYPQSNYLPNTYYWKGEAYYVLRDFDAAIGSFQTVLDQYPASSKVPDATLKLGFSLYELGQVEAAKETLKKVMELYPATSAARLAKVRFDRIK